MARTYLITLSDVNERLGTGIDTTSSSGPRGERNDQPSARCGIVYLKRVCRGFQFTGGPTQPRDFRSLRGVVRSLD